jgi:2-aminoadipate transaminase
VILELKRESHVPLYAQIAGQVREMIGQGVLKIGDRLPPNRELAKVLGVNRNTVTTAYEELAADGLISSHVGRGTFIDGMPPPSRKPLSKEKAQPSQMPWSALLADHRRDTWLGGLRFPDREKGMISLVCSLPQPELFPMDEFRRSINNAIKREGSVLIDSGSSGGYGPLQEYLVSQMALSGIRTSSDELVITTGCQQSLNLISQVLVGAGDEVVIETPTYPGAISVFCGSGGRHISVPVGREGIDLDVLEDILSQRRPKLIYTIPSFHNPTGVTMSLAARRRLIEIAARHRVPILEDDIYQGLRYEGPALLPLKALDEYGLVIYINSFSKVGVPGLRVGWISAPRIIAEQLSMAKRIADLHTGILAQAAIYEFSRHGLLAKHIKRIRRAFSQRRDAMLEALALHFPAEASWTKPDGGMAIWVKLPESLNADQILHDAMERGVTFSPGHHFYSSLPRHNMMRLSFTMVSPAEIHEAVKRLGAAVKQRLSAQKRQWANQGAEEYRALV